MGIRTRARATERTRRMRTTTAMTTTTRFRAVSRGTMTRARASGAATEKPVPKVIIDNKSDAFATVVEVSFGDYLGELLDTVASLKNLGLDINRGEVTMGTEPSRPSFTCSITIRAKR